MAAPRHLAFPLALGPNGRLLSNAQGTDAEIADCIQVVLAYPQGTRRGLPRFGIPEMLFDYPDIDAMRSAVALNEPRSEYAIELTDELLRGAVATLNLDFDPTASVE